MITFHLEAQSMEELRIAACNALSLKMPSAVGMIPTPVDQPDPSQSLGQLFDEEEQKQARIEPEAPPEGRKARRPHRRVKPVEAPVAAPVAPQEDERDPIEEALDALTDAVDALDDDVRDEADKTADRAANTAVANEMLKREVISSLADMFTAGNVKVVRHVLHKYGHGAKSFPEIEAIHFPEIKAALDRNEAA
jgi:hypothetical protein